MFNDDAPRAAAPTRSGDPQLSTPWGERLSREHPLAEYPRPALVRAAWQSLNGPWEYAIRPAARGRSIARQPIPGEFDGVITVPFAIETAASGVGSSLGPDEYIVYRRTVTIPWDGRVAFNFEAVDYECAVFADGVVLGTHRGGYLPFSFDLPEGVGAGGEHAGAREEGKGRRVVLTVLVRDPTDSGLQQRGKQTRTPGGIMYTATSGIWQSVWMEPLPAVAVTRVLAATRADRMGWSVVVETDDAKQPAATGQPAPAVQPTPTGQPAAGGTVTVDVELPDGTTVTATGRPGEPIEVVLPVAREWSPSDPHLYPVTVTTGSDTTATNASADTTGIDTVTTYAALRTLEWGPIPGADTGQKPAVLLNGQPIFLNTPLDQGYWPESGMTAPHDHALVFDLETMKDLGFNGVRKHIKVEQRRFYFHADRMGMLVVQDAVSGGSGTVTFAEAALVQVTGVMRGDRSRFDLARKGRTSLAVRREFEADLLGMIGLLEVHPSVVMWVPFNESWGQFESRRIEDMVRAADSTRLIDHASGWFDQGGGDVRSRHRYTLRLVRPPRRDPRPFYLSEFGGYTLPVEGHLWSGGGWGYKGYRNEADLAAAYRELFTRQLVPLIRHGLRGAVYTQLSDVEIETNGLLTYDRKVLKIPRDVIREANAAVMAEFAALGGRVS